MAAGDPTIKPTTAIPFWRDLRFWQIFLQVVFVIIVVIAGFQLANGIVSSLAETNQTPNFDFLSAPAGFGIGESVNYTPDDSYFVAFQVGLRNTLRVVVVGIIAATILGVFFGIFLLSNNWLLRTISRVYVEILRNTPLLVQLILWYFVVFAALPRPQDAIEFPASGILSFPIRYIVYAIVGLFLAIFTASMASNRRNNYVASGLVAASTFEILRWQVQQLLIRGNTSSIALAEQLVGGPNGLFIAIVIVLAILGFIVWRFIQVDGLKGALLAIIIGILIGVAAQFLGFIPEGAFSTEATLLSLGARGVFIPEMIPTPRFGAWIAFIGIGATIAGIQWVYLGDMTQRTGTLYPRVWYGIMALLVAMVLGWFLVQIGATQDTVLVTTDDGVLEEITIEQAIIDDYISVQESAQYTREPILFLPVVRETRRYVVGNALSPEYMAVLVGLVIYTSAFIAEIVRAGIQAVPQGQREAASALGLSNADMLVRIILPQALRVIIPPMGNQYLNLSKNSSLAVIASYADVYAVMNTIINQSAQSVPGIIIIMVTYLVISLIISFIMNTINQRFQLVTR